MGNDNKVRLAHELLDEIDAREDLTPEQTEVLRSFLPKRPKTVTLEQLRGRAHVAWMNARGNEWLLEDMDLKDWFLDLLENLERLIDEPKPTSPALPAGMRLAEHEKYGRVVVSPKTGEDGLCIVMYCRNDFETEADWGYEHESALTFIDAEPAKPTRPKFLETEADYENAPVGTIVAADKQQPMWKANEHWFSNNNPFSNYEMYGSPRRVLRWGTGES